MCSRGSWRARTAYFPQALLPEFASTVTLIHSSIRFLLCAAQLQSRVCFLVCAALAG